MGGNNDRQDNHSEKVFESGVQVAFLFQLLSQFPREIDPVLSGMCNDKLQICKKEITQYI